jgi:hypothetical protein
MQTITHRTTLRAERRGIAGKELERKIRDRSAKVGVVGLGYVGLSLAVEMAQKGYHVKGIDIDEAGVNAVNAGMSYNLVVPMRCFFHWYPRTGLRRLKRFQRWKSLTMMRKSEVDEYPGMLLGYSEAQLVSRVCSMGVDTQREATIAGTAGPIRIHEPVICTVTSMMKDGTNTILAQVFGGKSVTSFVKREMKDGNYIKPTFAPFVSK